MLSTDAYVSPFEFHLFGRDKLLGMTVSTRRHAPSFGREIDLLFLELIETKALYTDYKREFLKLEKRWLQRRSADHCEDPAHRGVWERAALEGVRPVVSPPPATGFS